METFLASLLGPVYLTLGLSLLLNHKSWYKLIQAFKKDHFGLFTMSLMMLILGVLLVNTYNVWAWDVYVLITITGWAMLLKAVFYFLASGSQIKASLKMTTPGMLKFGGLLHTTVGAVLCYYGYFL